MTELKKKKAETEDGTESVEWIHMGQWPCFVGFTTNEAAFKKERSRLGLDEDLPFLQHESAAATTWRVTHKTLNGICYLVTIQPPTRKVSKESYASMVAHEAMHIIQYMQDDYASGERLGYEAEAYLMQYLVMMMLGNAWNSKYTKAEKP